jgi:putative ABC transport system permease protein
MRTLESVQRDVRYARRVLARSRAFFATSVILIGLGVGANAAVFQLVDSVLLRPLPVRDAGRLVLIDLADRSAWSGRRTTGIPVLSNPLWERFRETQTTFGGVLAWANADLRVGRDGGRHTVRGLFVSGDFFGTLGVQPALGRVFSVNDDRSGCALAGVVVSNGFWRRELSGGPNAIGQTIVVNDRPVQVIGVTPPGFFGVEVGRDFDIAVPICSQPAIGQEAGWLTDGSLWWLTVMARLQPPLSLERANVELNAASSAVFAATVPVGASAEEARNYRGLRLRAIAAGTGVSAMRGRFGDPLILLLIITGLVSLLICVNLASLILSRTAARQPEFAMRMAVGASTVDVLRQLIVENAILASGGALVAMALCAVFSHILVSLLGGEVTIPLRLDASLTAFILLSATISCAIFGVVPAWRASRAAAQAAPAIISARGLTAASYGGTLRQALVTMQIGVSLVLLSGAFLFGGTLRNLLAVDTGFRPEDVIIARVDFSRSSFPSPDRAAIRARVLEVIRQVPGVVTAAQVRHVPLSGTGSSAAVWPEGGDPSSRTPIRLNGVSDEYFSTMGIRLIAGRDFSARDTAIAPRVALVNAMFVQRLGLSGNPIGTRLRLDDEAMTPVEIIGMVENTKQFTLREDFLPIAFVPIAQITDPRPFTDITIRSATSMSIANDVRRALGRLDGTLDVDFRTFESMVQRGLVRERLLATISTFFGLLAIAITVVGVYGTIVELVSRRRAEIGVRMALGAVKADILAMVFRRAGALTAFGLVLGALIVSAAADSVRALVFGVQALDVASIGYAVAILAGVATAATLLPAWRAASMAPLASLRDP